MFIEVLIPTFLFYALYDFNKSSKLISEFMQIQSLYKAVTYLYNTRSYNEFGIQIQYQKIKFIF